jgi:hypothetical protein
MSRTHDRGQLDSELFAAWWVGRWGIRAGVSHMSTETRRRVPWTAATIDSALSDSRVRGGGLPHRALTVSFPARSGALMGMALARPLRER